MSAPLSRGNKPTLLFWGAQPLLIRSVSIDVDTSQNSPSTFYRMEAPQEPTRIAKASFDIDGELCEYFGTPGTELKLCIVMQPERRWMIGDALIKSINHSQSVDGGSEMSVSIEGILKTQHLKE